MPRIAAAAAAKPHRAAQLVHTVHDPFGTVAAEFRHFPKAGMLYVRWCGHLTGDEVIHVAEEGLGVHRQLQPRGLLCDIRGTGGDWGDAATWLAYEWIPGVKAHGLRVIAFLLDPDTPVSYANAQMFEQLDRQFDFRAFFTGAPAWRWLRQRTRPLLPPLAAQSPARAKKVAGR